MNEERGSQLSTADMAAATKPNDANGTNGTSAISRPTTEPSNGQRDATAASMNDSKATNGARGSTAVADAEIRTEPLLSGSDSESLRSRWTDIQAQFVDEPRRCVEQADGLVADLMQRLAKMFADERAQLEGQWDRGDEVSTEDLRQALRRYRSFFERLLAV